MTSATGNDVGRKDGQTGSYKDDVPRLDRWLAAHPDAVYIPPDSNFRVRWGEVEFKAMQLGLLMDKLEQLDEPSPNSSASDG